MGAQCVIRCDGPRDQVRSLLRHAVIDMLAVITERFEQAAWLPDRIVNVYNGDVRGNGEPGVADLYHSEFVIAAVELPLSNRYPAQNGHFRACSAPT